MLGRERQLKILFFFRLDGGCTDGGCIAPRLGRTTLSTVQNDHSQLKRLAAQVTPEELLLSGKSKAKDSFLLCLSHRLPRL